MIEFTLEPEVHGFVETAPVTLKQLMEVGDLDSRTYNLCRMYRMETVADLQHYYATTGTFQKWRGCGLIAEQRLISVCKKYSNAIENVLVVDSAPQHFERLKQAKRALDLGMIDALVIVGSHSAVTSLGKKRVEGTIGLCANEVTADV